MIEQYGVYIQITGLIVLVAGWLWLAVRAFRHRIGWGLATLFPPAAPVYGLWRLRFVRGPMIALAVGLIATIAPPVYHGLAPVDLGPREKMVDGERHLTLTGWDRKDYSGLAERPDVVVLQMANPDVTDATLALLKGFDRLKELDLSDTRITDAGLMRLRDLPALATLRLKNTAVTDAGFRAALGDKESLKRLDLSGTGVGPETVDAWRSARPGRRAMR